MSKLQTTETLQTTEELKGILKKIVTDKDASAEALKDPSKVLT
jgi:hypothetical protein